MSKNTLTANQAAVLTTIGQQGFYITDGEFGGIFDTFAADLADRGTVKDKKTAKVVINQLLKKRIFSIDPETDALALTEAGKYAITEALGLEVEEPATQEAHLEELEDKFGTPEQRKAHLQSFGGENYRPATDEELDAALVAIAEHAAEEAEEDDLIGEVEKAVTQGDNYTVTEWTTTDDKDREVQWTETVFEDGSKTLKRRVQVSGAWRTDYWGTEAGAEKQAYTTAKAVKMARAYGTFTTAI